MEARWYGYQGYTGLLVEQDPFNDEIPQGGGFGNQGPQAPQGCQGPYMYGVQGTGGFGAQGCCPCLCCPPPCCSSVCTDWACGSQGVQGCTDPIVKEDGMTFLVLEDGVTFIGTEAEVSLASFTVCIIPGTQGSHGGQGSQGGQGGQGGQGVQGSGVCCIEYLGGSFRAVGNGYVDVNFSDPGSVGSCGTFTAKINGSVPPIYVTDGTSLTVTVESSDLVCCPCSQTGTSNPCGLSMRMAAIMKNDRIILDRKAVVQKVAALRRQKVQQKMRMLRSSPS